MKLYKCEVGMLATNCYLAVNEDNKQGVIVDPGADCDSIMELVEHAGVEKVVGILLTHGPYWRLKRGAPGYRCSCVHQ